MGKVIDMVTRQEITEMPATKAQGEALIENVLKFEIISNMRHIPTSQPLIDNLVTMIENNTGASRYEVMDRLYKARKV